MQKQNRILIGLIVTALLIAGLCMFTAVAGVTAYLTAQTPISLDNFFPKAAEQQVDLQDQPQTPIDTEVDLAKLFKPFWESRQLLHDNYVDQPVDDNVLAAGAVEGLRQTLELVDIDLEKLKAPADSPDAEALAASAKTPDESGEIFLSFWDAWRAVTYSDIDEDLTYEKLMQGALTGMVASLGDPHTAYMDPDTFKQTQIDLEGEYEGIGAYGIRPPNTSPSFHRWKALRRKKPAYCRETALSP